MAALIWSDVFWMTTGSGKFNDVTHCFRESCQASALCMHGSDRLAVKHAFVTLIWDSTTSTIPKRFVEFIHYY